MIYPHNGKRVWGENIVGNIVEKKKLWQKKLKKPHNNNSIYLEYRYSSSTHTTLTFNKTFYRLCLIHFYWPFLALAHIILVFIKAWYLLFLLLLISVSLSLCPFSPSMPKPNQNPTQMFCASQCTFQFFRFRRIHAHLSFNFTGLHNCHLLFPFQMCTA